MTTPEDRNSPTWRDENLLIVCAVEGYAHRHYMTTQETLKLFREYGVTGAIRQCYGTLHTQDISAAHREGKDLGLSPEELAFYHALSNPLRKKDYYTNEELKAMTVELTETLRKNRTIDWNRKEGPRAAMKMLVKRLLKKYRYPPEGEEEAVNTVISQCELWVEEEPQVPRP